MAQPLIRFPFPLQNGTIVYFELPPTFSKKDMERISTFLQTIVVGWDEKGEE